MGFLLILVYFALDGFRDAITWSRLGADSTKHNEHIILWSMRFVVMVLLIVQINPTLVVSSAFLFPLIHNGFYYMGRQLISEGRVYPKGFWSEPSETSTADINFSLKQRIGLAVIGVAIFLTYLIF